ncbi:MAG: FHA domain-containing protein [Proteobacteria bacterium]|nr:FHA domain-containing protein [Pseudomonadota bacterium]
MRCWLEHPEGVRRWIGPGGLLLGREADCDLVFEDSRISRHHLLVRVGSEGPEMIHMGKNPAKVNGKRHEGTVRLSDGDEVQLPGSPGIRVGVVDSGRRASMSWMIERSTGGRYGIRRFPFSMGGTEDDDLSFRGWPAGALVVRRAQGSLFLQASVPCQYNGKELDEMTPIFPGDRVEVDGEMMRFSLVGQDGERVTVVPERAKRIVSLTLTFLPTGGRLLVSFGDDETQVYMPERRFALLATLLSPQAVEPGDYVDDETVCSRVWPRNPNKGREHVNVLLKRAREDLVKAGLNGFNLLERARGGGATRFVLPPGAQVEVT